MVPFSSRDWSIYAIRVRAKVSFQKRRNFRETKFLRRKIFARQIFHAAKIPRSEISARQTGGKISPGVITGYGIIRVRYLYNLN